jgi:superfamily II DNA/RNA helicase/HKD family nuclease
MSHKSDTKFFTNTDRDSLYNRFLSTIRHTKNFDVLVGYFRTSGFFRLYKQLKDVEKIRILIGLNTDRRILEWLESSERQPGVDFESHKRCREIYIETLTSEMDTTEDSHEIELAALNFIEFIQSGKLELRAHPSRNLHAKIYITRFHEDDRDFGRVITGSSNFSENGLIAQREFNVELKDRVDVEYALERFEGLWAEGVDISEEYVETIHNKTWLNDQITPYQIYLKFLYEYFKEDINNAEELEFSLPNGFMDLAYQKQAVLSARKILGTYNGVFLADVVGLGKTFISALLLQKLPPGRKLIICPPVLMDYWRETLHQFYVPGFDVESLGKLDRIFERGVDKYTYIVVDEAHRFRNELTRGYEVLHKICRNKKVILVSATPLNNKLEDISTQIKLFQPAKNSIIPGVQNLELFFKAQQKELDQYEKGSPEYLDAAKRTSERVRDRVLKHVMVRRTRSEIKNHFSEDITKQGLTFPDMAEPQRIIYQFDAKTETAFNETIALLKQFSYARYTPLLYLKKQLSEFDQQSQRNVGGFMKGILVKRLESSFHAFKNSLQRFIRSYERFIEMYDEGTVWLSSKIDVFELLDAEDEGKLLSLLEEDKAQKYKSADFQTEYKDELWKDLFTLKKIANLWDSIDDDPKADYFINELKKDPLLSGKKILVFSESRETAEYLQGRLDEHFPGKVLSYSSHGGTFAGSPHKKEYLREIIRANYQPKYPDPQYTVNILITTDVLAEGINLHRSNIIVNYDLPWNPTRVLQRVGRVNRLGTEHDKIFVFNIFPTSQSDEHLGLEANIKGKIQAFHNTLGEDAKYLSDDEELSTHELFGERLVRKLSDKSTYQQEDNEDYTELRYLKIIRTIRDKNADLFAQIKNLPKKARTGRTPPEDYASANERLLTFFRKGRLKKFILTDANSPQEMTFLEAARLLECKPDTPAHKIPQDYFYLLQTNKDYLEEITGEDNIEMHATRGGSSNEAHIIKTIKGAMKFKGFTDDDEEYLKLVRRALEDGSVPRNTTKRIKQAIKKNLQPLNVLEVLREYISYDDLYRDSQKPKERAAREVILSEYLSGSKKRA